MPRTRFSPAALILAEYGVTQGEIADVLGKSHSQVGHYLRGFSQPHPGLIQAIRLRGGNQCADRVARVLGVEAVAS